MLRIKESSSIRIKKKLFFPGEKNFIKALYKKRLVITSMVEKGGRVAR